MTSSRLAALALCCFVTVGCGGSAEPERAAVRDEGAAADAAPAVADEVVSERIVSYFKKSISTPGLTLNVTGLQDSEIPGWRKGTLRAALGDQSQEIAFYVTPDGRYLLRGDAVDLTVDPLEEVMRKIVLAKQPARGPADAKVTVVEYSDFQCPYCARVYETLENQVLKEYGDRIRFVFKNFPLASIHPWAEDGAVASECAFAQGNDQFWAMYNGLFAKQSELTKENFEEKAVEIAKSAGLDVDAFQTCLQERKTLDAVHADEEEANTLGVNSTPTFFINGRRLSGAQTYEAFKQVLDAELAEDEEKS